MTSPTRPGDPVREHQQLVRELHDEIAQLLCRAFLQARGHQADPDVDELRSALHDLAGTISTALDELRTLDHLRSSDSAVSAVTAADGLEPRRSPSETAATWTATLRAHGIEVLIDIPPRADRLAVTVQGTILRTLEVVGHTAAARGGAGTVCAVTMTIESHHVALWAMMRGLDPVDRRPEGNAPPGTELDRIVAELQTRVRLLDGTLSVGGGEPGSLGSEWTLLLTLPRIGSSLQD